MSKSLIEDLEYFKNIGDRIGYYRTLSASGDPYGGLALGVVLNDTIAGATANYFMLNNSGISDFKYTPNLIVKMGIDLMVADFDARKTSISLGVNEIQSYHNNVFKSYGFSPDAWTPNIPLRLLSDPVEKEALWSSLLTSLPVVSWVDIVLKFFSGKGEDFQTKEYIEYTFKITLAGNIAGIGQLLDSSNIYGGFNVKVGEGNVIGGTEANETIEGTSSSDIIMGFDGGGYLAGHEGNDRIYGGSFADLLEGGLDIDALYGEEAADQLVGGRFNTADPSMFDDGVTDLLAGGAGKDQYYIYQEPHRAENPSVTPPTSTFIAGRDILYDSDGRGRINYYSFGGFDQNGMAEPPGYDSVSGYYFHTNGNYYYRYPGSTGSVNWLVEAKMLDLGYGEKFSLIMSYMNAYSVDRAAFVIQDFYNGDYGILLNGTNVQRRSMQTGSQDDDFLAPAAQAKSMGAKVLSINSDMSSSVAGPESNVTDQTSTGRLSGNGGNDGLPPEKWPSVK